MPYCIMRVQKIKSVSQTCAAINHNMRSASPENADIEITETENIYEAGEEQEQGLSHEQRNKLAEQAIAHYKAELPDKVRKNAVHAVEMVMTFSKEWADSPNYDPEKYLKACDEWAKSKLGEKNLICVAHHFDETTPHTCLIFIPKDEDGKLNCRKFIGGSRAVLSRLQDDFYEQVGKQFELDRGIKGSKAKHQDIKTFYGAVEGQKEYADDIVAQVVEGLPKKGFFEGNTAYKNRVHENLIQELAPVLSRELNKEHEIQHTRELQLTFNDRVEEAKEEIREDYENDVQREAERLTEEYNQVMRLQRNTIDALKKQREEEEKKQKKEKEDREKAEKEQKEAREKADEARQKAWDDERAQLEAQITNEKRIRSNCLFKSGSLQINGETFTCYGNDFTLDENGKLQELHGGIAHYAKELHRILNSDKDWFATAYSAIENTQTQSLKDAITVIQRGDRFKPGDIFEPAWYEIREDNVGQYAVLTDGKKTITDLGLIDFLKTEFEADTIQTGAKRRVHSIEIELDEATGGIGLIENYSKDDLRQDTDNQRELVLKLTPERLERERERQREKTR